MRDFHGPKRSRQGAGLRCAVGEAAISFRARLSKPALGAKTPSPSLYPCKYYSVINSPNRLDTKPIEAASRPPCGGKFYRHGPPCHVSRPWPSVDIDRARPATGREREGCGGRARLGDSRTPCGNISRADVASGQP